MNILVVDDEDVIVNGIVQRIEHMDGFNGRVLGACSGEEALRIMEYFRPFLMITDISMPGMDGFSLLSCAQEKNMCDHYLILTAYESFNYAQQAIRCHVLDYLLKPIDWEELKAHILRLGLQSDSQMNASQVISAHSHLFPEYAKKELSHTLHRIMRYVDTHFTKDISLANISSFANINPNSICNMFRKDLGLTYLDYVNQLRLKRSMELLLAPEDRTVHEIAILVGYKSERQFFRVFKGHVGTTPQQFREAHLPES